MRQISLTSFGRQQVSAGLLATRSLAVAPAPACPPDKWALLRDLTAARRDFGITDRDLAVLSALLSFHPGRDLADDAGLIVFPSNRALAERAHGMAESTLRRHLATLVRAGLVLRNDSPNGKRYATRDRSGALNNVFGFNLRPLLVRASDIAARAEAARADALHLKRLREIAVIRLRDATKLIEWVRDATPPGCNRLHDQAALLHRYLRRKLDASALIELTRAAEALINDAENYLPAPESEPCATELSADDSQNERHYQNSHTDYLESETTAKKTKTTNDTNTRQPAVTRNTTVTKETLPLPLILQAAPEITLYAKHGIQNWRDLAATAAEVRPMLGISVDAWTYAIRAIGNHGAVVTLCCMLQNSARITNPGGYLRRLAAKAEAGRFTPGPMVRALLRGASPCTA